jgi:hypothetical protein
MSAETNLADRVDVIDALYRFAAGQDMADEALFASAFAEDAELDFVQPAARLGVEVPVFKGKRQIVETIVRNFGRLDTTHTVTNPRVRFEGGTAELFALVEAQHLPKGDHSRYLMLKNIYETKLRREAAGWRITHMRIRNVWMSGDSRVLFP